MVHHDLLGLYVSKLAFSKWSHGLQHEVHCYMLGCSRKFGGSAKNICIKKVSKQKYIIKKKEKKNITFHRAKKVSSSKSHKSLFIK